ncbi:hypothetical protein [Citrobacter freundii]|jgi:hypothetical protein|uniref:hypothetical protein n=1 Tax=Citrobacter portucalensis TaxID=1639133 RepID=UPI0018832AF9|nr:hypothetical protein [Citrobacter freundii]
MSSKVNKMNQVATYTKYWEQCWDPKVCIDIPFDGTQCIGAHICVRIIEDSGTFFIEAEINGSAVRYALADACIPALSVGIVSLEICVTGLNIVDNSLKSLHLEVKGCLGADIGPIHLGKCWTLYGQDIIFNILTEAQVYSMSGVVLNKSNQTGHKFIVSSVSSLTNSRCTCG